jgi:hypothetical protein
VAERRVNQAVRVSMSTEQDDKRLTSQPQVVCIPRNVHPTVALRQSVIETTLLLALEILLNFLTEHISGRA